MMKPCERMKRGVHRATLCLCLCCLVTMLAAACADESELLEPTVAPPEGETADSVAAGPITLHLNCSTALALRSNSVLNPYFENVINTLFTLHFDKDGIRRNYTPLETISGSQTSTEYSITLNDIPSTGSSYLYVLCNFTEAEYNSVVAEALTLTRFKSMTFGIEDCSESNRSSDYYIPSLGYYVGSVTNDMSLNVSLGRYVARVTTEVVTASASITYSGVSIGIHNAPRRLRYLPADDSDDYQTLTAGNTTTDFFSDAEMTDATPFNVTSTTATTATTRYFYVGENLSADEALQSKIRLTGTNAVTGKTFDKLVPITTGGIVDRNSNYELLIQLQ